MLESLFSGLGTEIIKKIICPREPNNIIKIENVAINSISPILHNECEKNATTRTRIQEIAERLNYIITQIKEGYETFDFTIAKMAELMGYERVTPLEKYCLRGDEPSFDELNKISKLFGVNFHWLNCGNGTPFYSSLKWDSNPLSCYEIIMQLNPVSVYFIQSDCKDRSSTLLLKMNSYHYTFCPTHWNISENVGNTGERQIFDYYNLINKLKNNYRGFLCGRVLRASDYRNLCSGHIFPGVIFKKYNYVNYWWDDLTDIEQNLHHSHYVQLYGEPFKYAQKIIKTFLNI